jgi:hypothetical protein
VPLLTRYDTPAGLRDLPSDSPFYQVWHNKVASIVSGFSGGQWFDPLVADAEVIATRQLSWMGFPRKFMTVAFRDNREKAFEIAETGENRQNQPEYFEWHTTRDTAGKITKVVFVTETPEYWQVLAEIEPDRLVSLYQEIVHPDVQKSDLFQNGTYNVLNRWNTADGIVHYVMNINNLQAAVDLAQRGASNTAVSDNYADEIPRDEHSADDYITREVGAIARKGYSVTVHDPTGLYIDGWDDTGWTKPDGSPVGDYWRVTRGRSGAVLRLEYEVPDAEGFVVGDIEIGGRPVTHGGQLAEHISLALPVLVARNLS